MLFWHFLAPKSSQNRSWMRLVFQNAIFHEILAPPMNFNVFRPNLSPKIEPRGSQERHFFVFVFDFEFGTIWVPFWLPKGLPLGVLSVLKSLPQNGPNLIFQKERSHTVSKEPSRASKRRSRAPNRLPRGSQEAPRSAQEAFKRLQ